MLDNVLQLRPGQNIDDAMSKAELLEADTQSSVMAGLSPEAKEKAKKLFENFKNGSFSAKKDNSRQQLNKIQPVHRHMMRLLLRNFEHSEIAVKLGLSQATVTRTINSDLFQREFARLQSLADERVITEVTDHRSKIEELTGVALANIERMLKDPFTGEKLVADLSWDLLDRGGYKAPEVHNNNNVNVNIDYKDAVVEAWKRRKERDKDMPIQGIGIPIIAEQPELDFNRPLEEQIQLPLFVEKVEE